MGNWCCACLKKGDDYFEDDSERQPILAESDRVRINEARIERRESCTEVSIGAGDSSFGGGIDHINNYGAISDVLEESNQSQVINNVLTKLTAQVVDIAAIEKPGEQANFTEREKKIQERLSKIKKTVTLGVNQPLTMHGDSSQKDTDPMSFEDYREITEISRAVKEAIDTSFVLNSDKRFIVTFNNGENQTR